MGKFWEFFENMEENVYVSDPATHEVVYMNKKARETYGFDSMEAAGEKPCYQTLRGFREPCETCVCVDLRPGEFRQWRYYDSHMDRHYLLRDSMVEQDGRWYLMEMAQDISDQTRQDSVVRSVQRMEATINEGIRAALQAENPDQSLEMLLTYLGRALEGARTYIFERTAACYDNNTYEWVSEGIRPVKEDLQNIPPEVCAGWYRNFSMGGYIVIHNLEEIRETEPLVYRLLRNQGVVSMAAVPLYDEGRMIGFYGVDDPSAKNLEHASDMLQITAHFIVSTLRRRNLLRELRERSRNVLYALNVDYLGIYEVDFDTDRCVTYRDSPRLRNERIVDFDDGYEASMERYVQWYVIPKDQARIREITRKDYVLEQLRTRQRFFVRYQVTNNDLVGTKNIEIHFSLTGREGADHCVIFAFRDVNSIVAQEEQYREETRRGLEDILEGSRTGIWTIELEEDCPPRMYADRTMRMLLGVDETVGPEECYQSWYANIEPGYEKAVQDAVREILETGRSEVVYPWNHPELGKIYVRCGGVPDQTFDKPGVGLHGYHQDITEVTVTRKKQEQAIMELLERVRQANSAKSEFLSRMSHDLRTPINAILGMLTIMESTQGGLERQRQCRKNIRVAAEHLLSLVSDVLEVSKLESGRPSEVEEPYDLKSILRDCLTILEPQADEADVSLTLNEEGVYHSRIIGNPLRLKQILMNIIDNAVKYNRPGGAVSVQAEELEDGQYRFTIQDTGVGISKDFIPHLFEPFTQENYGARTDYAGAGLGLAITKKLTEQLAGTIEVDSRQGLGSTFRVTLPLRAGGQREVTEEEEKKPDISGMQVLLVEDNAMNREIVEFILRQSGASVVSAQDGKAAVDTFAASAPGTFDCVLMDLMMPVMSGFEATRVIRAMDGRPDAALVPIIALSANAFEEDVAMSKAAGMNEHLAKPVDIHKLFRTMSRLVRRSGKTGGVRV